MPYTLRAVPFCCLVPLLVNADDHLHDSFGDRVAHKTAVHAPRLV